MNESLCIVLKGFPERLREVRLSARLTQEQMAQAGGVTRTAQVRYEAGETFPSLDFFAGIQSLPIDFHYVLYAKKKPEYGDEVEWKVLRESVEACEYFRVRADTDRSEDYLWELIRKTYLAIKSTPRTK